MKWPLKAAAIMIVVSWLTSGCTLFRLREESAQLSKYSKMSGRVTSTSPHNKPIQVVVIAVSGDTTAVRAIVRRAVMHQPGEFQFWVPPGTYRVGAFEDANEDLTFQSDEWVGWHGAPDTLSITEKDDPININLAVTLRPPEQAKKEFPKLYRAPPPEMADALKNISLGEVVELSDPRFVRANGAMGLWEPLKFINEIGYGIFFLERFDPQKIPILFVHGAGGNPGEWGPIVAAMDRQRFQPWLLYYPSGIRLTMLSKGLEDAVAALRVSHHFDSLFVVAHSMGGLVSRGFINRVVQKKQADFLRLFVTLSTPWGGHELASTGVESSPAVVPSWYDMVPGSPFTEMLFKTQSPEHLEYYLFFSHRGGWNMMTGGNTDGAVSLRSQLVQPAQRSAIQIRGYHEDHVGILSSPDVIERLNILFADRLARLAMTN